MGLESLFLFTLLGGLAAGTYVFETFYARKREGDRPWLVVLVVVVVFAIALGIATTHVHNIGRAFGSLGSGLVNFESGMTQEVACAGCFFVLALIDLICTAARKSSPFALRVVTAVVAVVCICEMGIAYIDIYGNAIWCNAAATVILFVGGALAMGASFAPALGAGSFESKTTRGVFVAANAVLLVGMCLEAAACVAGGASALPQIAGIVIAPVASTVVVAVSAKASNKRSFAWTAAVLTFAGVAISRYAFYATIAVAML